MTNEGEVKITSADLNDSYHKYRKDLITMPVFALEKILPFVTLRPGVRGKETVSELKGKMSIGPFDPLKKPHGNVEIIPRTLETFLGNDIQPFDPSSVVKTILGNELLLSDDIKKIPLTKKVWTYLMGLCGESVFNEVFTSKRDNQGSTSKELFNGFCTIADAEKEKGNLVEGQNYFELKEHITKVNAVEKVESIFDAADSKLKGQHTNLIMSPTAYANYCKDYRDRYGSLNYNREYKKVYIEGSNEKCALTPLENMPDGKYILSTKSNLLMGICTSSADAYFAVKNSLLSHYMLDFIANLWFGTEFQSINKEMLLYTREVVAP